MLRIKTNKKSYAILLVNLLLIITVFLIYNKTEEVIKTDQEERLLSKINLNIDSILISLKDAQRSERGFVISGNKSYLSTFYNSKNRLDKIVGDLKLSLENQKDIRGKITTSERLIRNAFKKFDEIITIREDKGAVLDVLTKMDYEAKLNIDTLQNNIREIENYEKAELDYDSQKSRDSLTEIVFYLIMSGMFIGSTVIVLSISLVRDILKREELSLKLEGSERRYHFLFELSADGIIVTDLNGIITDCNTAACKIFGYTKKELMGKSYHIIWPDEFKHLLPKKVDRDTVTGDTLIERTFVRKNGTLIHAEVYTKFIEINGLSNIVAHVRDVTEKKQTQKVIAVSETKYRTLFEKSLAGIFRTTVDGQILECNNEYARVLGFDSVDDIKNISTKNIYADHIDREKLVSLLRTQGEVKDLVMKLKKNDGSYVWVYDSVTMMYDEDLNKEILFGTLVDITAQKEAELKLIESEKKYKDLVELLPQTVYEFDLNAKVTFANKAGFEAFGYTQEEFEKGLNVFELIVPEDRERAKRNVEVALKGIKQTNNEYVVRRKDGTTFPVLIYSSPLLKDNKPVGIRGIVIDISELKQSEKLLKQSENRFRSLIEKSPVGIAISRKSKYEYVNDQFLKIFGYGDLSEVTKLSIIDTLAPNYKKIVLERNMQREAGVGVINSYEAYGVRKDKSIFPLQVYVETIELNDGIATIAFITDITERKKSEEKINMLAHSLESISECISITDTNNIILYVNDSMVKTYGLEKEELIGRHISVVQPQSFMTTEMQNEILTKTNEGGWKGEIINKRRDGSEFPVYLSTSIVKDYENNPIALIGVSSDITERKRTEKALRLSEQKYKDIFYWSPIGIYQSDGDGNLLTVNESLVKILGYNSTDELLKQNLRKDIYCSEEERDKLILKYDRPDRGAAFDLEILWKKKDGSPIWISLTTHAIRNDSNKTIYYEGFVHDITNRKRAEESLRESELLFHTLAQNSPVGIFRTREDGYTTYVNPKWCQLSGMSEEEAIGDGWLRAVHPDDKIILAKRWKEATEKKLHSIAEYRFVRPDGSIIWVMGQSIPELNPENQTVGYVGTITDITKIKLYEYELIKAKESAEESDKIKSEFLSQISHEIRTPINVMISSADYLKDELEGIIDKELSSAFYSMDAAGKRIIRTVDLILNMSQIQTNSYVCNSVELNLTGKFLTSIYSEFLSFAKEKNLELNFHRNTMDANIYADEYSVRQIFCNLIDNAIKYTNEGKVDLTVDIDADRRVMVSIADTGIGISKEFLSRMYEPFMQEEQGYSRSFEGNGLGLALVKKYCDLNNATISVESEKEKGTVFKVTFNS